MGLTAFEIPEDIASHDLEPSDMDQIRAWDAKFEKMSGSAFAESGNTAKFITPQTAEEGELAAACFSEAKQAFKAMPEESRKGTSVAAMAAEMFSDRVLTMRQAQKNTQLSDPQPSVAVSQPQQHSQPASVLPPAPQPSQPQNPPAPSPELQGGVPDHPDMIREPITGTNNIFRRTELSETQVREYAVRAPLPKKRMKMSEIEEALGIENYGIFPKAPEIRVDFVDTENPTAVAFSKWVHWVGVQSNELGVDKNMSLFIDRRWQIGGDRVPPELGRKQGSWYVYVYEGGVKYACEALDTRIISDFFRVREIVLLIVKSETSNQTQRGDADGQVWSYQ